MEPPRGCSGLHCQPTPRACVCVQAGGGTPGPGKKDEDPAASGYDVEAAALTGALRLLVAVQRVCGDASLSSACHCLLPAD